MVGKSRFEEDAISAVIRIITSKAEKLNAKILDIDREVSMGRGRADLVITIREASKELNEYVFEMKSGVVDMSHGIGLNFYGNVNWLVYPEEEYTCGLQLWKELAEAFLDGMGYDYVGIIRLNKDGTLKVEREAIYGTREKR